MKKMVSGAVSKLRSKSYSAGFGREPPSLMSLYPTSSSSTDSSPVSSSSSSSSSPFSGHRPDKNRSAEDLFEAKARRLQMAAELAVSEEAYIRALQDMVAVYKKPLLLHLPAEQVQVIFSIVDTIVELHSQLSQRLQQALLAQTEQRASRDMEQSFAEVLEQMASMLRCYAVYVKNYPAAVDTLTTCEASDTDLARLLQSLAREAQLHPLHTHLLLPFNQAARYLPFFEHWRSCTPARHPDFPALQQVIKVLREVLDEKACLCDALFDSSSSLAILSLVIQRVPGHFPIAKGNRSLVTRTELLLRNPCNGSCLDRTVVFLFNDALFFTEVTAQKTSLLRVGRHHSQPSTTDEDDSSGGSSSNSSNSSNSNNNLAIPACRRSNSSPAWSDGRNTSPRARLYNYVESISLAEHDQGSLVLSNLGRGFFSITVLEGPDGQDERSFELQEPSDSIHEPPRLLFFRTLCSLLGRAIPAEAPSDSDADDDFDCASPQRRRLSSLFRRRSPRRRAHLTTRSEPGTPFGPAGTSGTAKAMLMALTDEEEEVMLRSWVPEWIITTAASAGASGTAAAGGGTGEGRDRGHSVSGWGTQQLLAGGAGTVAVAVHERMHHQGLVDAGILPPNAMALLGPPLCWDDVECRDALDDASGGSVAVVPGYRFELGGKQVRPQLLVLPFFMYPALERPFYLAHLAAHDHLHLLGCRSEDPTSQPVVVSVETHPHAPALEYRRAVVRSQRGEYHVLVPVAVRLAAPASKSQSALVAFLERELPDLVPEAMSWRVVRSVGGGSGKDSPKASSSASPPSLPTTISLLPTTSTTATTQTLGETLIEYDLQQSRMFTALKVGVVCTKDGDMAQLSDRRMFQTQSTSPNFQEFLDFLGEPVALQGYGGFSGGLDTRTGLTGTHSLHTAFRTADSTIDIMFHVSTLLPFTEDDDQQLAKKRHIGNDVVVIVFHEDTVPFDPRVFVSKMNQVFVVVSKIGRSPENQPVYRLAFICKDQAPCFPVLPARPEFIANRNFHRFLLAKIVNAEATAQLSCPAFVARNMRARAGALARIIATSQE